jgi:hypothetical protein
MDIETLLLRNLTDTAIFEPPGFSNPKYYKEKRIGYKSSGSFLDKILDVIYNPQLFYNKIASIGIILLSIILFIILESKVFSIILFILGLFLLTMSFL